MLPGRGGGASHLVTRKGEAHVCERARSHARAARARQKALGICRRCGRAAARPTKSTCAPCAEKEADRARRARIEARKRSRAPSPDLIDDQEFIDIVRAVLRKVPLYGERRQSEAERFYRVFADSPHAHCKRARLHA